MREFWAWWNLIYVVPLIMALLYLGVSVTFGLFEGSDADHDVDHDIDHDVDVDHDVELNADHDVDSDADADADHDAEGDGEGGVDPAALLLWAIGAKQVTVGLALQFLMLCWGLIGLAVNDALSGWLPSPRVFILPSLAVTSVGSVLVTRLLTTTLGRILPKEDTAALRRSDLEGLVAQCLFAIDHDSGVAIVKDRYGHRHQVACRTQGDEIPRGAELVLLEYVPERDYYVCEEVPDDLPSTRASRLSDSAQDTPSTKVDA